MVKSRDKHWEFVKEQFVKEFVQINQYIKEDNCKYYCAI